MEIDITRAILLGVVILAAFSLGVMSGSAYVKRKMRRRERHELADYLPDEKIFAATEREKKRRGETKEDDETKDGKNGWGIGEGHEGPSE